MYMCLHWAAVITSQHVACLSAQAGLPVQETLQRTSKRSILTQPMYGFVWVVNRHPPTMFLMPAPILSLQQSVTGFPAASLVLQHPILDLLLGVARGMECLHAQNWVVGDIRAGNIMLAYNCSDNTEAAAVTLTASEPQAASQHGGLLRPRTADEPSTLASVPRQQSGTCEDSAEVVTMHLVPKIAELGVGR